jgi:hypothetical protein
MTLISSLISYASKTSLTDQDKNFNALIPPNIQLDSAFLFSYVINEILSLNDFYQYSTVDWQVQYPAVEISNEEK